MRHRGSCSKSVSFRLSGKPLRELERQAEEFGLSPGDLSRSIVTRYLGASELKDILAAIEALAGYHETQSSSLRDELRALSADAQSLRRDFNRAVGIKDP
jgi:hypothetical protein